MASQITDPESSGRTKPVYSDEEDDLESEDNVSFFEEAKGKFRSRVNQYDQRADYPAAPLYNVGEVVYLVVTGRAGPAGPYVVVSVSADMQYTIKRQDNGQIHGEAVREANLVVRQS